MVCTVLGKKGSGKTTKLLAMARKWSSEHPWSPIFIHDCRGWGRATAGALAPAGARYRDLSEFFRRGVVKGRLAHRVNLLYQCPAEDLFKLGCWYLEHQRPCLLFCDELDRLPSILRNNDPAYRCLHYGRLPGVDVFGSARAPQNVDKAWLSQADELVLFHLTTVQVLRQLSALGTLEGLRASQIVPRLPPYKYVVVHP